MLFEWCLFLSQDLVLKVKINILDGILDQNVCFYTWFYISDQNVYSLDTISTFLAIEMVLKNVYFLELL